MSNDAVNNVFNAFVEAQRAMQRLPEAEAELAKAKGELGVTYDKLDRAYMGQSNLQDEIYRLRDELAAKEAALSDATFREEQTRNQLQMLVGTLKSVVGEAHAAVELVEPPKPEPVVEAVSVDPNAGSVSAASGTDTQGLSRDIPPAGQGGTEPSGDVDWRAQRDANPTQADSTSGMTTTSAGIGGSEPYSPFTDGAQPTSPSTASTSGDSGSATELPGRFPWEKEENRNSDPSNVPAPAPTAQTPDASTTAPSKPYAGRAYWHKPDSMTWAEWMSKGGDKAPWVNSDGSDHAMSIANK